MTDDLVQRLRRTYRKEYAPTGSMIGVISNRLRPFPILAADVLFNPDGREAADRIEAQAAEIERLRAEAKAQFDRGYYDGCANPIVRCDALREAVEEERERCAQIAENIIGANQYDTMDTDCYQDTADRIAAAIRNNSPMPWRPLASQL